MSDSPGSLLWLSGDLERSDTKETYEGIRKLARSAQPICLDLSSVTGMDLSVIQILAAFCTDLSRHDQKVKVVGIGDRLRAEWSAVGWSGFPAGVLE